MNKLFVLSPKEKYFMPVFILQKLPKLHLVRHFFFPMRWLQVEQPLSKHVRPNEHPPPGDSHHSSQAFSLTHLFLCFDAVLDQNDEIIMVNFNLKKIDEIIQYFKEMVLIFPAVFSLYFP